MNERTKELALLLEVSQNIASTLDLKPLLDTILTQLKTVVDYHAAVLYALQDDRLTILNYQGEQPLEQIKGLLSLFEQDMTRILRRRQHDPLVIDDIYQQTRLSQRSAEEVGTYPVMESAHLHSWMGVPLMAKDQAIGLLTLSHSQPRYYGRRHANLVRALANQAAVGRGRGRGETLGVVEPGSRSPQLPPSAADAPLLPAQSSPCARTGRATASDQHGVPRCV